MACEKLDAIVQARDCASSGGAFQAARYTKYGMIHVFRPIPTERLRLLIFDLDGTLVDSQLDLAHAINAMLRKYGRAELPTDLIASYIGDGAPMLVRRALGDPDDQQFVLEALEFFMRHYREHKLDNTFVYPGIVEQLELCQAAGLKMAVLSNKPVVPSRGICEGLGLSKFFTQIYGGNSLETKKPDPLGARRLLEENGVRAEEAIIIGDSQNDVLTASNAGTWSLGVTYGFSPETLQRHPPDVLVDETREIGVALGLRAAPAGRNGTTAEIPSREGFTG